MKYVIDAQGLYGLRSKWEEFMVEETISAYKVCELETGKAREGINLPIVIPASNFTLVQNRMPS